jgi:hypothetical protein
LETKEKAKEFDYSLVNTFELEKLSPYVMANVLYRAGYFKDAQNFAQILAKILAGRAYGLDPFQSMNSIYIFNGKTCFMTSVFLAEIRKSAGRYAYYVLESDDKHCKIEFRIEDKVVGISEFNEEDAKRADLIKDYADPDPRHAINGKPAIIKGVYSKYPKDMYFWRAALAGIKRYMPDIINGRSSYEEEREIIEVQQESETKEKGNKVICYDGKGEFSSKNKPEIAQTQSADNSEENGE